MSEVAIADLNSLSPHPHHALIYDEEVKEGSPDERWRSPPSMKVLAFQFFPSALCLLPPASCLLPFLMSACW